MHFTLIQKALYVAKVEEHEKLQQLPGKTSASGVSVYILAVIWVADQSLICCDLKEEGRSEDEAVQLYFQRLTMTTMLRRVVKRSVADFVFLVTTHHTHGILETFSYMFSLCCLGWKPMTKKLKFVAWVNLSALKKKRFSQMFMELMSFFFFFPAFVLPQYIF